MLKSSFFNQFHFFKIKIKDGDVLNFSFFQKESFCVCMHGEGETEGGYVPNCTATYSQGGTSKISTFCVRNSPQPKKVIKKLAKLLKPSYLN